MVKAAAVVVKKKRWVPIVAPKLFNEQLIGESYVGEPQELMNRHVSVSLMVLTGDPQKQAVNVGFKITGIGKDAVTTEMIGYKLSAPAAKKMMRRKRSKIDDSFVVETSDKKIVRIKPVIVTRNRVTGQVLATMRKLSRAFLAKMISKTSFDDLVRDIVTKKMQSSLSQVLRKLHPVGACEIRMFELIPQEKVKELGIKITLPPENLPDLLPKPQVQEEKVEAPQTGV